MERLAKRFAAAILGLSMLFSACPVFAEEADQSVAVDNKAVVLELSLEDAINMAKENNPQLKAADAKIKSNELSLEVVEETQKEFDKMAKHIKIAVKVSDGLDMAYLKHGYYPKATKVGYDLAILEKTKTEASIAYDVTQKYYNVKLMEELIAISEKGVQLACDNAEVVKKNYELGYVSALEVKNVDASVKKAQYSLDANNRNLEIARESLKIALQIEGDCTFILTDEILLPSLPENASEKMAAAMDTRYDVTALKKAYELSEEHFNITSAYVGDSTALYNSSYSDYLSSKYTYENTSKLIALSLKNDYAAILTAKENIISAENDLSIKQVEYDSSVIKYEMGLITNLELTAKMTELDSCKVQLENARLSYLLAVLKFDYNTTIGI